MSKAFPQTEEGILKFWQENKIFEKSLEQRRGGRLYSFYDGPPFATGLPHYGHFPSSIMKDVIPRYRTMKGDYVERRWGWDCHGLPIENIVEANLKINSKKEILDLGVDKFNDACRAEVLRYQDEWRKTIDRLGRWVDMDNHYMTMDVSYMESIWWVFKQLWDKGLIYEDFKSMHVCPRCETTLAQAEVTEGYRMVKDLAITAKFELEDEPGTFVLAWTTTPWTLPGNVALGVGNDIEYVKVQKKGEDEKFILAKDRFQDLEEEYKVAESFRGGKLVGKKYKPLFDYYKNADLENKENIFTIVASPYVNTQEGTGIVHEAPAYGEEDRLLGLEKNLPMIQHVSMNGRFKNEVTDLAGKEVKPKDDPTQTDIEVMKLLQTKGLLFKKEKYEHSYPHCWRCDSSLLNYATSSLFVSVTKIKNRTLEHAKKIHWTPDHLKEGRFGNWLEGARDWAISRQRFWGSVIPLWICECGEKKVFGSIKELQEASGKKVDDLHKHIVDEIEFDCTCGKIFKRTPDVLDTWFDSGSMPYAQAHYPFENKEKFEKSFPADFIAEGVDQTIKWFYYLHIIATALKDEEAYKNVIANGIVLAEDGRKMSKRLKNYPDPGEIMEKYGADALRYYMLTSQVLKAGDLKFSETEVVEVYRNVVMLSNNILNFYKMYSEDFGINERKPSDENILDIWIISRLNQFLTEVSKQLEVYDLVRAARPITGFVQDLSTWYLRRSRDRFKDNDKKGIETFGYVLLEMSKIIAPFTPYLAEHIYKTVTSNKGLVTGGYKESVHLEDWPKAENTKIKSQENVLEKMEITRKVVELGLAARAEAKIKVRQPLQELSVFGADFSQEYSDLVKDEVNVKELSFKKNSELKVELTVEMTKDLLLEGEARELIRQINTLRKSAGMTIHDSVDIVYDGEIFDLVEKFGEDIKKATLSSSITKGGGQHEVTINEKVVKISLLKK